MAKRVITMRSGNKGLTVKINLWALDKYKENFDSQMARLWITGVVTNADSGEEKVFNDAGELLTILGKWNTKKLRSLQSQ